jgi:hypothetical protein
MQNERIQLLVSLRLCASQELTLLALTCLFGRMRFIGLLQDDYHFQSRTFCVQTYRTTISHNPLRIESGIQTIL